MQLCYSENAVNYYKKYRAIRGAASHIDLGAEGDVRPPALQYNNIINVLVFRWRNDWLVGLQFFFSKLELSKGKIMLNVNVKRMTGISRFKNHVSGLKKFLYWHNILQYFGSVSVFFFFSISV